MKKHSLYYSNLCFFCQRVLFELRDKEHSIDLRATSSAEHHRDLVAGGGKGQVPCLRIEDGDHSTWMYESDDIVNYLKQQKII